MGSAVWFAYLGSVGLLCWCQFGALENQFCKSGLSEDGLSCSGGCEFGHAIDENGMACGKDILAPGMERCVYPDIWKNISQSSYGDHMKCTECKSGWNGTYCTRENIPYNDRKKLQDGDLETCGSIKKSKKLVLNKTLTNAVVIDLYPKVKAPKDPKLYACKVKKCERKMWMPDGALRLTCNTSLIEFRIKCGSKKKPVTVCEVKVSACAPFWSGLEKGCSEPCTCQDGVACDPLSGECPPGKDAVTHETTTTPASTSSTGLTSPSTALDTTGSNTADDRWTGEEHRPTTERFGPGQGVSEGTTDRPASTQGSRATQPESPVMTSTVNITGKELTTEGMTGITTQPSVSDARTTVDGSYFTPSTREAAGASAFPTATELDVSTDMPPSTPEVTSPSTADTTRMTSRTSVRTARPSVTSMMTEPPFTTADTGGVSTHTRGTTPVTGHPTVTPGVTGGKEDGVQDTSSEVADFENQLTDGRSNSRNSHREGGGTDTMTAVWAALGAMMVLVAVAVGAGVMYKRSQGRREKTGVTADTACVVDMEMDDRTPSSSKEDREENDYANVSDPFTLTTEPITLDAFKNHVCYMKRVGGYSKEFQELPHGILAPVTAAEEVNNGSVKKNRFKDISPYDDTRVTLKKEKDSDSDYINASYIDGFAEAMAYIAAQGPLPGTVGDFWHMVWTEGCSRIVMLTNLCEGSKVKCERYWPESVGASQSFGGYTVTSVKVIEKAHFVQRQLSVSKLPEQGQDGGPSREVQQFHFTAWPDHGVPCPVALVRFWTSVILHPVKLGGPMLVHCSAGIGRTGTFIALDMLSHQAETSGKVSVFPTVRRLRKQRVNMVQTLSQYKFLHQVVQEWLCSRDGDVVRDDVLHGSRWKGEEGEPLTQLPAAVKQQCAAQFQLLDELRPTPSGEEVGTAGQDGNARKNRSPHVLPVEQFRVCLATSDDKESDYINAVFFPSLTRQQGYIVTQLPLANTVADFWRMVRDWRVGTIVRFKDALEDQTSVYPEEGAKEQHGALGVSTVSKAVVTPGLSLYKLRLQEMQVPSRVREVSVYCVDSQQAVSMQATKVFVSLVDILLPLAKTAGQPPIVLQCLNGSGPSCVLCAVLMAIESLQEEKRTSPFLLARLVHTARPQAFSQPEQYEFMVRCLLHHTRGIVEEGEVTSRADHEKDGAVSNDPDHIYSNV